MASKNGATPTSNENTAPAKKATQIVVGISDSANWQRLTTWALATEEIQSNMPTGDADTVARAAINRAVKSLVFANIDGLNRSLEKERAAKGQTASTPVSALDALMPAGVKLSKADKVKARELALQQALLDPAVMAAMRAAMANVASNVDKAEALQEAAKLER